MILQIMVLSLLLLFYLTYFAKAIILKRQGISVDLLGKGDKPQMAARIEIILKLITWGGAGIKFVSAMFPKMIWSFYLSIPVQIFGIILATIGVIFFIVAVVTMHNNWRAGFDKNQNTSLVSNGIYKFSRNPAFVGFDLVYIGCALCFPNIVMIVVATIAVVAFHIQIIGEENFLEETFGQEYMNYKSKVRRYL